MAGPDRRFQLVRVSSARSRKLADVSPLAELTYYKLLLVTDDLGRFPASPVAIAGAVFEHRMARGEVNGDLLHAIVRQLSAIGLIEIYVGEDGDEYLQVVNLDRPMRKGRGPVVRWPAKPNRGPLADNGQPPSTHPSTPLPTTPTTTRDCDASGAVDGGGGASGRLGVDGVGPSDASLKAVAEALLYKHLTTDPVGIAANFIPTALAYLTQALERHGIDRTTAWVRNVAASAPRAKNPGAWALGALRNGKVEDVKPLPAPTYHKEWDLNTDEDKRIAESKRRWKDGLA